MWKRVKDYDLILKELAQINILWLLLFAIFLGSFPLTSSKYMLWITYDRQERK